MKKSIILLISILFISFCNAQDIVANLSNSYCKCLSLSGKIPDSFRKQTCLLYAFKLTAGIPKSEKKQKELIMKSFIYLEKYCPEYLKLIYRLKPLKGDWEFSDSSIQSRLDTSECRKICSYNNLYYLETNGDTTYLSLKNNFWIDTFKNKASYSKLKLKWKSSCDFEIEFIESNNYAKNQLSKKGDKYFYRIIDKTSTYYLLNMLFGNSWYEFKIYYQ